MTSWKSTAGNAAAATNPSAPTRGAWRRARRSVRAPYGNVVTARGPPRDPSDDIAPLLYESAPASEDLYLEAGTGRRTRSSRAGSVTSPVSKPRIVAELDGRVVGVLAGCPLEVYDAQDRHRTSSPSATARRGAGRR